MRKLAREAVIFMLLGPIVAAPAVFAFFQHRSVGDVKTEAARSVHAIDAVQEPAGFRPINSVLVPLTNGVKLYVTDCNQAHQLVWFDQNAPPPGAHGGDCVYFSDPYQKELQQSGGRLASISLGDENQVAIEKDYWLAYSKAKSQHRIENAMAAVVLSLWGFPAGIIVWLFYRLVRFAVKG